MVSRTGPDGSKTDFTYDDFGNVIQVDRNGKPAIRYRRDALGRITGEQDSLGRVRRMASDANGNILADYAPDGTVTRYEYDRFNRRTAQIDGNGHKVCFTFDPGSNLTQQVNALGDTVKWSYDEQWRIAWESAADDASSGAGALFCFAAAVLGPVQVKRAGWREPQQGLEQGASEEHSQWLRDEGATQLQALLRLARRVGVLWATGFVARSVT